MARFKCIRNWARNTKGDILEQYEYNRIPQELKLTHFEVYNEPSALVAAPVASAISTVDVKPTPVKVEAEAPAPVVADEPVNPVGSLDRIIDGDRSKKIKNA